jgi:hypothetical protein
VAPKPSQQTLHQQGGRRLIGYGFGRCALHGCRA